MLISAHFNAAASAWPNPARPRNSMKSALSFAVSANFCARIFPTIAWKSASVGVNRIGFSCRRCFMPKTGERAIMPSPSAIVNMARIVSRA